jgi:two-component system sensor histidine kinase/response regulator
VQGHAVNEEWDDRFDPMPVPSRDEARLQGRLILVAENDETNRSVIAHQLRTIGFAADSCFDGCKALQSWRSGDYALLLTDLHMPEMDGFALVAAIRAEEDAGSRMPVIALTAKESRDEELRCLDSGMDAYLPKPIRLSQLKAAIEGGLAAATQRSAGPSPPVDLGVLTDFVGEDPSVIAELLQAFRESAAESRRDLQRCLNAGLTRPACDAAHKLKSAARTVGALRLADICAEIEETDQPGRTDVLDQLHARFEIELDAVLRFIEPS